MTGAFILSIFTFSMWLASQHERMTELENRVEELGKYVYDKE